MIEALELVAVLVAVAVAFFVSASAGLGGSLVLVPALSVALGTKEGVALSALLLGANNLVKVLLYRQSLPWRRSAVLVVCTVAGAAVGARLLVGASERLVTIAVITSFVVALATERVGDHRRSVPDGTQPARALAGAYAVGSGATSGFSGTSGPLKGIAVRSLRVDRFHTVGAAALVSAAGDLTKSAVYADAQLLGPMSYRLMIALVPLMLVASMAGRRWNGTIGERGYERLFWIVIGGYAVRLVV